MTRVLLLLPLTLPLPLAAAEPPAPVTLPGERGTAVARLSIGRPTEYATTVLAFSPDGKTLAATTNRGYTGGMDAPVHLWDAATGKHLHALRWHTVGVMAAAFSPDGTVLATSGIDNKLRFWDPKAGKDITKADISLSGHGYALSFSPDGKRLLVGSTRLEMYDVGEQKPIKPKPGYFTATAGNQFFHAASWSPKGKYVAAGCDGAGVRIWEADTGALVRAVPVQYTPNRTRFAFSADDKLFLVATWPHGLMAVYDVESGKETKSVPTPKGEAAPEQVQFAREMGRVAWVAQAQPDQQGGRALAVADATGQELKRFDVPAGVLSHLLNHDGSRLAVGGHDGSLRVYAAETGNLEATMLGGWSPVYQAVYADGGKVIRTVHTNGLVHDFAADAGKPLREARLALAAAPHLIAVSADGAFLASASDAGDCVLWDLAAGKELARPKGKLFAHRERVFGPGPFPLPPGPIRPGLPPQPGPPPPPVRPGGPPPPVEHLGLPQFVACFTADGKAFAALTGDGGTVTVWETATGTEQHAVKVPPGTGSVALSVGGTHLFAGQGQVAAADPDAPPGARPGASFVARFDLKTGKEDGSWKPASAPAKKNGRYAHSGARMLHPLADGERLAVVEAQVYHPWPPPPGLPGGRMPVHTYTSVRLIDLTGKRPDAVLEAEPGAGGVGVSADGKRVWFVGREVSRAVVRVIDTTTGTAAEAALGDMRHDGGKAQVVFRPDGKEFVVTSGDGLLLVVEAARLAEKK